MHDVLARLDGSFDKRCRCCCLHVRAAWWLAAWASPGWSDAKFRRRFRAPARHRFFCIPRKHCMAIWACSREGMPLLAVSYGGETEEIVRLLGALKRLEISLVTLTGNTSSTLASQRCGAGCARERRSLLSKSGAHREHYRRDGCRGCAWQLRCWSGADFAMMILRRCILLAAWAISCCAWNI